MQRLSIPKGPSRPLFIIIALFCSCCVVLLLYRNQIQQEKSHYSEQQAILDTAYRAAIQSYRLAMESFFDNALDTPTTLELFRRGVDTSGTARDLARGKLYRHLYGAYESMKRQNLLHLQFHLADGTSYLRFHQPDRYGDALFASRPSVRLSNKENRVVQGMELGKIRSGFRYVFPLNADGRHLGSVEVSVTFKAILDALKELDQGKEYGYVLNKTLVDQFLFPEQRWLYSPSNLNDQYVVEDADATLPNSPAPLSKTAKMLNGMLNGMPEVQNAMQAGQLLSITVKREGIPYTVTLLPLKDLDHRLAGYLVAYARDPLWGQIHQEFIILLLYSLVALFLIIALIWRLNQRTMALAEEQRKLGAMNNALAEGVYVQDINGIVEWINPAACHMLGYEEKELIGQIAHDLFHRHADNGFCPKEECAFFSQTSHGEEFNGEEHFLCKNGSLLVMEVSSRPILQEDRLVGAVIAFHDITDRKKTEAALRRSEALGRRLSTAVEQSPASVIITDAKGTIEYVNQKFTQITGYSVREAIGKNPRILKSGVMPEAIYTNLWETIAAGFEWKGELQNKRKDGTLFWESISVSPIRNEIGIITHFIAIKEDITGRMRMEADLRENERIQRTLIESLPIGLAIIDSKTHVIEEVNPFAAALIGADREAIVGHPCHKFLCPGNEASCPISDLGQTVDNSDRIILRADGTEIPVLKTVRTIAIKGRAKMLECFVDIRERKKAEENVRSANRRLGEALIRAGLLAREAESANRAKSQFLANMSHEIRTPMNAIIGMTHLAMQTRDGEKQRRFLETVQHSAESLLGLLNDILDFSKMEAGQLQLNSVTFAPLHLAEGILTTLTMPAEEKGLQLLHSLSPDLPEYLVGDDMRLRQILLNLVGNAIKFTDKGSVSLQLTLEDASAPDEPRVHFRVSDTGIGIPEGKLSQIFNSFEQVDSTYARRFGGTGLGLSICRQLVALMHGRIWAESTLNSGSIFHVVVPLKVGRAADLPETKPLDEISLSQPGKLRILVVDDNAVNRDVAMMLLEEEHSVATATNGLEALQALARDDFDILLMDVQMPVMDGLTATGLIRRLEQGKPLDIELPDTIPPELAHRLRGRHMIIIAMTAHAMGGDREMCLKSGMDTYITKPFQPGQLLEVLHFRQPVRQPAALDSPESIPMNQTTPQAKTVPPPTSQEVMEYLRQSTMLNDEQIKRILAAVQASLVDNLAKAEAASTDGDLDTLIKTSHTLKGTLLQCGLNDWAGKAQFIHDAAKQGQNQPFIELLEEIRTGMCHLI
ncbi:MAG: PAS domain S-box protein [Desulfobulbus sp.]